MNVSLAYLETQITTAAPQQLRLMLIEGALRFARQTVREWQEERREDALESLTRCRSIVTELIAGIREGSSPLANQVLEIYLFLFNELTQAQLLRDVARMEGVIRVLEEERVTWQEVCFALASCSEESRPQPPHEILAPAYVQMPGHMEAAESISFEA